MISKILLFCGINIIAMTAFSDSYKSLHDFTVVSLEGKDFDMSQLKGKKVVLVLSGGNLTYEELLKSLK